MHAETLREFWRIYNRQFNEMGKLYHRLARHYGLSDCAFWMMYTLREEGRPMTQAQLSGELSLSKQTVNSALKNLAAAGYVRLEDAGSTKNKRIYMTEQGEVFLRGSIDQVLQMERDATARLTAGERDAILTLGQRHLDAFREETENFLKGKGDEGVLCRSSYPIISPTGG